MAALIGIGLLILAIAYFAGMYGIDKMGKYKRDDDKTF